MRITTSPLPEHAFLAGYRNAGNYTDCYCMLYDGSVDLEEFIIAFYTTPLFKLERWILARFAGRPSSDDQVRQLACANRSDFAAWLVERRAGNQVLLSDVRGRTRSWLMSMPAARDPSAQTRLFFGSAVVFDGLARPWWWTPILTFHRLYSRSLLWSALRRLQRHGSTATNSQG